MSASTWRFDFFRSLSTLLGAGVTFHRSLLFAAEQQNENERKCYLDIAGMLEDGYRASQALAAQGHRFDAFHINLVRVGEQTGALVRVLSELESYEERRLLHRRMLSAKLTYPAVLAFVCLVVVVFLPLLCLDGLLQVIEQNMDTVPFLTRLLMQLNELLTKPLLWVLLILGAGLLLKYRVVLFHKIRGHHLSWQLLALVPPLNQLRHLSAAYIFSSSLALQLEAGLTPLDAIPLAAGATGDPAWGEMSLRCRDRLIDGESLHDACEPEEVFDTLLLSMLAVGQETGKLPSLLKNYAKMNYEELEYRLERLMALVEPLLLLLMGFVFGLLMLATLQPMLKLVQNL